MSGPDTPPEIAVPDGITAARAERAAREFALVYHELKEQTFASTTWLGVPLLKTAADILVLQQIIVETRPELIVETGVYIGGSAMLFASLQEALGIDGRVIAVDVDLATAHDRVREHPRIELIEGSSTDPEIVSRIEAAAEGKRTMVDLDADHRAHHVLEELRTYSPLVSPNCYLVVEDSWFGGRPVRPDAVPGPSEALDAWLADGPPFEPDRWRERYLLTQNPRGYLRRLPDDGAPPRGPERPADFLTGSLELTGTASDGRDWGESAVAEANGAGSEDAGSAAPGAGARAELERRRGDLTVEGMLRELDTQRELLQERNRELEQARATIRRIGAALPYRAYMRLRSLPGIRQLADRRSRRRRAGSEHRRLARERERAAATERFVNHDRGQ